MAIKNTVIYFLEDFKIKMKLYGVLFLGRDKNIQTLLELDISPLDREHILEELVVEDYSEGPKKDINGGADLWIFGKIVKQQEVYIKITLGEFDNSPLCISFHLAEYPMNYPLK